MTAIHADRIHATRIQADRISARRIGEGDAASPLIFSASLQNSLTPSKATGSPTPTFTRASSATFVDYAGVVKTVASNVPRFMGARLDGDGSTFHLTKVDGVTPIGAGDYYADSDGPLGYVAEGARTNICSYSEDFDNAAWVKSEATISANAAVSPSGYTTAEKLIESAANNNHFIANTPSTVIGTVYTFSVYVKKAERSWARLRVNDTTGYRVWFNVDAGSVGAEDSPGIGKIEAVGNGWYRCSIKQAAAAVNSGLQIFVETGNGVTSYAGDGASGLYIWGAQIESGSYPGTYIPTTTAAVTRNAGSGSYASSSNITTANGVMVLEWTPPYTGMGTVALWGSYVDANNYTRIFHDGTNVVFRRRVSGVNYDATKALTYAAGTTYKIAARISDATGGDVFVAGVKGTNSSNTSALQLGANFSVGHDGNGANHSFAPIRNVKHYDTALTDVQVAAI